MGGIVDKIQSGTWLTHERVRAYSLLMLGIEIAIGLGWIAVSNGLIDPNGTPIGSDFSSFYAAASLAFEGRALDVYDPALHLARQQATFGPDARYYAFAYPPIFLLLLTPLAAFSYPVALALFQFGTLLAYVLVIRAILKPADRIAHSPASRRLGVLVALAFPAVFINLGHGQNGLLSAALIGAAVLTCRTQPIISGVCFGLLAYKPQFAAVIPVALIAAGLWRTVVSTTLTVIVVCLASTIAYGFEIWHLYFHISDLARLLLLEQGAVGFEKLQTAFAAVRMWGGSVLVAYALQSSLTITTALAVLRCWFASRDHNAANAVLIVGTLLASPHVLDYDLVILAPAIAFMARSGMQSGFRPYEISALAAIWVIPLLARSTAILTGVPLGLFGLLILFSLAVWRCITALPQPVVSTQR